jgi:acyl carrier protein
LIGPVGGSTRRAVSVGGDGSAAGPAGGALRQRLAELTVSDQERVLLDLTCADAAAVLGHASAGTIGPDRPFKDLGFDSLTAVELRNRLNTATGLRLPATLVFDYPTPSALGGYLRTRLTDQNVDHQPVMAELDRLQTAIISFSGGDDGKLRIADRLKAMLHELRADEIGTVEDERELDAASDDEMISIVEDELRTSEFD